MKRVVVILVLLFLVSSCNIIGEDIEEPTEPALEKNVFIAIHLEPGGQPTTTDYPEQYWPTLIDLVEAADQFDQKLNLFFNPQWGTYILEDPEKLSLVREWESNGHLLGMHHHGPHHGSWNGYTNQDEFMINGKYMGTMDDAMEIMNQLPINGKILAGTFAVDEDKPYDHPDVYYSADGGLYMEADIVTVPTLVEYNGHEVLELSHAIYGTGGNSAVSLDSVQVAIDSMNKDEVAGIVWHCKNFEDAIPYIQLFEYFVEEGIQTKTVPNSV
jgi:hypothetical protein